MCLDPAFCICVFFFFPSATFILGDKVTVHALFTHCSRTVHTLFMHCSQDPRLLYSEKNIKNESHGTIHPFKNYFAIVFSVFSKISCIQTNL